MSEAHFDQTRTFRADGVRELRGKVFDRFRARGFHARTPANPYWERSGAVGFVDPDGYWLILSPDAW